VRKRKKLFSPNETDGRREICTAIPKHACTESEFSWGEQIQNTQKYALSGVPGINTNISTNEDSSALDICTILFSTKLFKLIQK
jgi:hypothetical protein